MYIRFKQGEILGDQLLEWWSELEDRRADRAQLRRADSTAEVIMTPAFQHLCRRIGGREWSETQREHFAAVVGLLAHVRADHDEEPAKSMSRHAEGSDRPVVSALRFRRLLESPDLETLFSGLRRALPLVDGRIHLLQLATDVMHFFDRDDKVRKRWAYEYVWPEKTAE